ncbi:MAG TPA: RagB/SusD family nutrient uptake outer membrane protein, partial [Puia sp.]
RARMGGQDAAAQALMWELQDKRGADRTASTGAALVSDILVERRKELYGEGFAWFDMLRTGAGLARTGDHPIIINLPARSWRLIFQLPTSEFTSNKSLKPSDQNPYDGVF